MFLRQNPCSVAFNTTDSHRNTRLQPEDARHYKIGTEVDDSNREAPLPEEGARPVLPIPRPQGVPCPSLQDYLANGLLLNYCTASTESPFHTIYFNRPPHRSEPPSIAHSRGAQLYPTAVVFIVTTWLSDLLGFYSTL